MSNGYSINWKNLEVNQVGEGTPVHPILAILFSIAVGGLFVVFLPFIGLYMSVGFLLKKIGVGLGDLFDAAVAPQAAPGVSHFTGAGPGSSASEETLKNLQKEIEQSRSE